MLRIEMIRAKVSRPGAGQVATAPVSRSAHAAVVYGRRAPRPTSPMQDITSVCKSLPRSDHNWRSICAPQRGHALPVHACSHPVHFCAHSVFPSYSPIFHHLQSGFSVCMQSVYVWILQYNALYIMSVYVRCMQFAFRRSSRDFAGFCGLSRALLGAPVAGLFRSSRILRPSKAYPKPAMGSYQGLLISA